MKERIVPIFPMSGVPMAAPRGRFLSPCMNALHAEPSQSEMSSWTRSQSQSTGTGNSVTLEKVTVGDISPSLLRSEGSSGQGDKHNC